MSDSEHGSYLLQLVDPRDASVEPYAIVDTDAEMRELKAALEQHHPARRVHVVDLVALAERSCND